MTQTQNKRIVINGKNFNIEPRNIRIDVRSNEKKEEQDRDCAWGGATGS